MGWSSFEYLHTPRKFRQDLSPVLRQRIDRTALECFHLLMLRDYGRVDMRVDDHGQIHVLEVNANPSDAGFAAAVGETGMTYADMARSSLDSRSTDQEAMRIRPVTTHDMKEILRLLRQRGIFNQKGIRVALDVIDEALDRPEKRDYQVFCARDGNANLAGYICFGPIPMTDNCYDLYWIAVDKRFSRKGVGGELLRFMEQFVISEGG